MMSRPTVLLDPEITDLESLTFNIVKCQYIVVYMNVPIIEKNITFLTIKLLIVDYSYSSVSHVQNTT